ncbi:MAG TPA: fumarylacetoacetate hydrolase family protein [Candidatus Limnocylindria bacterium]|nr:fumarylacetoacetate hydrolase family protein [Candidatus Limnocylindria bacterium]
MKLISYRTPSAFAGEPGRTDNLGIVEGESVVATASLGHGVPGTMAELLQGFPDSLQVLQAAYRAAEQPETLALNSVELLAPVPRPGKIVAAGVNYAAHAAEGGRDAPDHPVLFAKMTTSVVGHGAEIRWSPGLTQFVDFEAELAVVIGRTCRRVGESAALGYVAGYTCLDDVSARDLQYSDKQFVRAKSLDTFCPMGPWLVTADEITDPQALRVRCLVNGEVMQDAPTSEMVFGVAALVSFCSQAFTLEPGDVIATGTPSGVGWFRDPKRALKDGDEVVVDIEHIGRLVNRCREEVA